MEPSAKFFARCVTGLVAICLMCLDRFVWLCHACQMMSTFQIIQVKVLESGYTMC